MSYGGTRGAAGGVLVRFETRDGLVKWRSLPSFDHRTLCRAAGLDESITFFDVPKSFLGGSGSNGRRIEGMILQSGQPIGKVTIAREGERFNDDTFDETIRRM